MLFRMSSVGVVCLGADTADAAAEAAARLALLPLPLLSLVELIRMGVSYFTSELFGGCMAQVKLRQVH